MLKSLSSFPSGVHDPAGDAVRFRALVAQNAVGVAETDETGRFRFVNETFCAITGYPAAELLELRIEDITHPDDLPSNTANLQRLLHEGQPFAMEKRYRRKDGGEVWVSLSAVRVQSAPTQAPGVLGLVLDLSSQRRAELAVLSSEQSYRTLFNSIDAGFCVIEVIFDHDQRPVDYVFLETNALFEKLTDLRNARGARMRALAPEHEQHWYDIYGRVALTGVPIRFEQVARALRRWYGVHAFPIGDGAIRKVGILFEDITARRLTELRRAFLADLGEKLAPLRDEAEIIRIAVEALGHFLEVDRCCFVECPGTENRLVVSESYVKEDAPPVAEGLSLSELGDAAWWRAGAAGPCAVEDVTTHPLTKPRAASFVRLGVRAYLLQPFRREFPGTTLLLVANSTPRAWTSEEAALVEHVVARVWPLVERARSERALMASQAELERRVAERTARLRETLSELESFSYSISHDLRAPLRAMHTYASILSQDCGTVLSAERLDYLRRIMSSAERMDQLIRDVLSFSRLARSAMPKERVELDEFIGGLVGVFPGLNAGAAEIELIPPLGAVRANPAALTQCLSNLLGNALKFARPGIPPRIRIWTDTTAAERRRLFVRDNGIGIPPDAQDKIFSIFYQIDPSKDGTGIGLAIVRKAAERMGGSIGVASTPGEGSTFWIELDDAGDATS